MSIWPHQNDVIEFYGDPRGKDGFINRSWESSNIVKLKAPWKLVTAWDFSEVRHIRIHKNCIDSLESVLTSIWDASGQREERIREWGMHLFAGALDFRMMRGGTRLSMHSWGCAVDFDSARNFLGDSTPNFALIPPVLDAFSAEGWIWGGTWRKPDGMHFQAARV